MSIDLKVEIMNRSLRFSVLIIPLIRQALEATQSYMTSTLALDHFEGIMRAKMEGRAH